MSSQQSEVEFLENLCSWTEDEIADGYESVLPKLKIFVGDKHFLKRSLKFLFGSCLSALPLDRLEELIFQFTLPCIQQVVNDEFNHIDKKIKENAASLISVIRHSLSFINDYLTDIDGVFHYLLQQRNLKDYSVVSLPLYTISILQAVFNHCKTSEDAYGTNFSNLSDLLTDLYQKSHQLLNKILKLLLESIQFKCYLDDDLNSLVEILNSLVKIGKTVMSLDVKTMADVWKGYGRLSERYSEHLRDHLDIAGAICYLSTDVQHKIDIILNEAKFDVKLGIKTIKISNFILKIIIKLTESYNGYLGECHDQLLQLIIKLYQHTTSYLLCLTNSEELANEFEKNLFVAAEPLLTLLLEDRGFIMSVKNYIDKFNNSTDIKSGFIYFICVLLRKLSNLNNTIVMIWLNILQADLLNVVFSILEICHLELCSDYHQVQSIMFDGRPKYYTDLYEVLLCSTVAFIVTLPVTVFVSIEKLLVRNVLQSNIWCAMFATDVWCLIARFSSAEICFTHTEILTKLLLSLPNSVPRPELVYLKLLIKRLYQLLSQTHKKIYLDKFPPDVHPTLCSLLDHRHAGLHFQSNKCFTLCHKFLSSTITHTEMLELEAHAYNLCVSENVDATVTDFTVKLWFSLNFENNNSDLFKKHWVRRLFQLASVCCCKLMLVLDDDQLLNILRCVHHLLQSCTIFDFLCVTDVLESLGTRRIENSTSSSSFRKITSDIFQFLLLHPDELVRVKTFESFSHFAHMTDSPQIVTMSTNNQVSRLALNKYLKGEPCRTLTLEEIKLFVLEQNERHFEHFCENDLISGVQEPLSKKPKLDECRNDLNETLVRINSDVDKLVNLKLNLNELETVKNICDRLLRLL